MKTKTIIKLIVIPIIYLLGAWALEWNWKIAGGIILFMWANNIERRLNEK